MTKKISRIRHHVNPLADRTDHSFDGFDNDKPIIVDVGADRGEFVVALLDKFGDSKNFIVFEIRIPLAQQLREKFKSHNNVMVFDGDAGRNFESILDPCIKKDIKIEEIYINFPDPWVKERQKKRRFLNEKFLKVVKTIISQETKWVFQTDHEQLFDETVELLQENHVQQLSFFSDLPYGFTTKWEDAKVKEGKKIYRLSFYLQHNIQRVAHI